MFTWWFIRLIGCLCLSIIHSQDTVPELADIEPHQDDAVQVGLSVDDGSVQQMNNTNNIVGNEDIATRIIPTTIQTPVPFSCHECTNCNSKSDYLPHVCDSGIKMCYKMEKRINNNTRIIRRGCSASKTQCTVPDDDQTHTIESITCCTSHKCNQATQFKPLFFLSILSLSISRKTILFYY